MDRVATLTEAEFQVLTAVRSMVTDVENTARTASGNDMRRELEDIYNLLSSTPNWEYEELVSDVTRRIYALLH